MEQTNQEMGGATFAQDEADEEYAQNQLLAAEAKAEWLNQNMQISIKIGEHELYSNYALKDGQVPEDIKAMIQSTVDTLLDTSEL